MDAAAAQAALRVIEALDAVAAVGAASGDLAAPDGTLQTIAARSLDAIGAASMVVGLLDGDEFAVVAAAGKGVDGLTGMRLPIAGSLVEGPLVDGRSARFTGLSEASLPSPLVGASSAMFVPVRHETRTVGFLAAFDPVTDAVAGFSEEDERMVRALAFAAGAAIATARHGDRDAIRSAVEEAERERGRWAVELHEEVLQELASLRMLLNVARRAADGEAVAAALAEAHDLSTSAIAGLRRVIVELRPATLDGLGLAGALEGLAARVSGDSALLVDVRCDLCAPDPGGADHLRRAIDATAYRIVQAALRCAIAAGRPGRITVAVVEDGPELSVRVSHRLSTDPAALNEALAPVASVVDLLGGRLGCTPGDGQDCVVAATIPLDAPPPLTHLARQIAPPG